MARKQSDPEKAKKPFPTALRTIMESQNITQTALAKHLKRSPQAVSLYCTGDSSPDPETLVKIAEFLKTSTDYLLGLEPDPAKKPSAATELGLSSSAIENIRFYAEDSGEALHGLDLLLNSLDFYGVCLSISRLQKHVESLSAETHPDLDHSRQRDLEEELANAHPELRNRIQVLYGDAALSSMSAQALSFFTHAADHATGLEQRRLLPFVNSLKGGNNGNY